MTGTLEDRPNQPAAARERSLAETYVNGIFKGGGAKGIVYAGALQATQARAIRFSSVAGTSAGAITATLIAAKLTLDEIVQATTDGLIAIRGPFPLSWLRAAIRFLPFLDKPVFAARQLGLWLEGLLAKQLGREGQHSDPVTFLELFRATSIELYVVSLDLATRQPIVFHHSTTPDCSVTAAVLASSAIPVALPPGRALVRESGGEETVHRLVDGGAWANYPAFVFKDESFRRYHELTGVPMEDVTIGFTIDYPPPPAKRRARVLRLERRTREPGDLGAGVRAKPFGPLLNWPILRFASLLVLPPLFGLIMFQWTTDSVRRFYSFTSSWPTLVQPLALIALLMSTAAFFFLVAVSMILVYRFGTHAFDVGYPALMASMSVGMRVPDWVGAADDDHVIRLTPPENVSTMSFSLEKGIQSEVIAAACTQARGELARRQLGIEPT